MSSESSGDLGGASRHQLVRSVEELWRDSTSSGELRGFLGSSGSFEELVPAPGDLVRAPTSSRDLREARMERRGALEISESFEELGRSRELGER